MIKLTESNKENILELFVLIYQCPTIYDEKLERFLVVFNDELTDREIEILTLRYGLDGGGLKTIAEAARELGIGRERLRQIESKAIKKLLHQGRRKYIFGIENKEDIKNSKLIETKLSSGTIEYLRNVGINTINDLLNAKINTIIDIKDLDENSFQEILDFISSIRT